jgi:hypothetical protein
MSETPFSFAKSDDGASFPVRRASRHKNQRSLIGTKSLLRMPV